MIHITSNAASISYSTTKQSTTQKSENIPNYFRIAKPEESKNQSSTKRKGTK